MLQKFENLQTDTHRPNSELPTATSDSLILPYMVHTPDSPGGITIDEVHEAYGSDGIALRTELALQHYGLGNHEQVRKAQTLANAFHATDKRSDGYEGKSARHIDHVNRIVLGLLENGVNDADTITAAFIHDAGIEDHAWEMALKHPDFQPQGSQPPEKDFPWHIPLSPKDQSIEEQLLLRQLAHESIQHHFPNKADPEGPSIADMVLTLSNPVVLPGENKLESYNNHLSEIDEAHPKVQAIKLMDVFDNATRNRYTSNIPKEGELASKQLKGDVKHEQATSHAINWLRNRNSIFPVEFQEGIEQEIQLRSQEATERRKAAGRGALMEVRHSLYANTVRTQVEQRALGISKHLSSFAIAAHVALYLPRTDSKDTD